MRLSTLGVAIAALVASFASAHALPPVQAGILECRGGQNVGFVVGSVTSLECVFQAKAAVLSPTSQRPPLRPGYRLHRSDPVFLGGERTDHQDWTRRSRRQLRWRRRQRIGRARGGGNFLVGGPQNSYALQPVSVQGQTGLNVAAGVADIELQPVRLAHGGPRRHMHHHRRHH